MLPHLILRPIVTALDDTDFPQPELPGMAVVPVPLKDEISRAVTYSATKGSTLRKTVDALAIVPTKERLSLLARKTYNVMMYLAQEQGVEQSIYRARLRDVVTSLEFNSKNTEVLKEHLRQMVTTKVEWQSPSTGEGARWGVSALIAHADLVHVGGEVIMEWSYAPTIKQAILDPERYAKISLQFQAAFKSMGGLALYEICARYVDNPAGVTARQAWTWWRPVLTGEPESYVWGAYEEWKYFKRDVIKGAVAEVNRLTDLSVEAIEHRRGRSVVDLQFKVARKSKVPRPLAGIPSPVNLLDIGRAIQAGVPQEKAEKLFEKHGEAAFQAAISALEMRAERRDLPEVRSPSKFLLAILTSSPEPHELNSSNTSPKKEEKAVRVAHLERYRDWKRQEAQALFNELTEQMQRDKLAEFEMRVITRAPPALQRSYKSKALGTPMTRALFLKFLADDAYGGGWETPTDTELLNYTLMQ